MAGGLLRALSGRRAGVAIVQPHDIDVAVARCLAESGLASVMLPTGDLGLPSYHDPRFDPLWAACVENGLPVTFHSGGTPWEGYGPDSMWVTKVEFMWWARRPLWQLIFGGVFERFPDLRVVFTEQGADWIPAMLDRLDEQYALPVRAGNHRQPVQVAVGLLGSNCYVGASFMSRGDAPSATTSASTASCGARTTRTSRARGRTRWRRCGRHSPAARPRRSARCRATTPRGSTASTSTLCDRSPSGSARRLTRSSPRIDRPRPRTRPVDYTLGKVSGMETGRRLFSSLLDG